MIVQNCLAVQKGLVVQNRLAVHNGLVVQNRIAIQNCSDDSELTFGEINRPA
jgi:hypothetical protein